MTVQGVRGAASVPATGVVPLTPPRLLPEEVGAGRAPLVRLQTCLAAVDVVGEGVAMAPTRAPLGGGDAPRAAWEAAVIAEEAPAIPSLSRPCPSAAVVAVGGETRGVEADAGVVGTVPLLAQGVGALDGTTGASDAVLPVVPRVLLAARPNAVQGVDVAVLRHEEEAAAEGGAPRLSEALRTVTVAAVVATALLAAVVPVVVRVRP